MMIFLQDLDTSGRPLVLPTLAVTGAFLDMRGEDAAELLEGAGRLAGALTAPLRHRAGRHRPDRPGPVERAHRRCGGRLRVPRPDP